MLVLNIEGNIYAIQRSNIATVHALDCYRDVENMDVGNIVFSVKDSLDITDFEIKLNDQIITASDCNTTCIGTDTDEWTSDALYIDITNVFGTCILTIENCDAETFDPAKLQLNYTEIEYQGHVNYWLKLLQSATYENIPCSIDIKASSKKEQNVSLSYTIEDNGTLLDSVLLYQKRTTTEPASYSMFMKPNIESPTQEEPLL